MVRLPAIRFECVWREPLCAARGENLYLPKILDFQRFSLYHRVNKEFFLSKSVSVYALESRNRPRGSFEAREIMHGEVAGNPLRVCLA